MPRFKGLWRLSGEGVSSRILAIRAIPWLIFPVMETGRFTGFSGTGFCETEPVWGLFDLWVRTP